MEKRQPYAIRSGPVQRTHLIHIAKISLQEGLEKRIATSRAERWTARVLGSEHWLSSRSGSHNCGPALCLSLEPNSASPERAVRARTPRLPACCAGFHCEAPVKSLACRSRARVGRSTLLAVVTPARGLSSAADQQEDQTHQWGPHIVRSRWTVASPSEGICPDPGHDTNEDRR